MGKTHYPGVVWVWTTSDADGSSARWALRRHKLDRSNITLLQSQRSKPPTAGNPWQRTLDLKTNMLQGTLEMRWRELYPVWTTSPRASEQGWPLVGGWASEASESIEVHMYGLFIDGKDLSFRFSALNFNHIRPCWLTRNIAGSRNSKSFQISDL